MRTNALLTVIVLIAGSTVAHADLLSTFNGYDAVWGIGSSGYQSSYHADTKAGEAVSGALTGNQLPSFSKSLVSYPSGIGEVPSPGGAVGAQYDQGVLGLAHFDDGLSFLLATAIDPRVGVYNKAWKTWYGQGDLFVDVADSRGIRHYALLNAWAHESDGDPLAINRDFHSDAANFHLHGGAADSDITGSLVMLESDADVSLSGGRGAYTSKNAPAGLDLRLYAKGGSHVADGNLTITEVIDNDKTWYLQNWTIPAAALSTDVSYDVALHSAASCGNDQIGMTLSVPEPASMMLTLLGLAVTLRGRRFA